MTVLAPRVALAGVLVLLVGGCAAERRAVPRAAPGACTPVQPAVSLQQLAAPISPSTVEGVFRAVVVAEGSRHAAEGVLLAEPGGAVRLEIHGPLALAVHRAAWRLEGEALVGELSWPLDRRRERVVEMAGEPEWQGPGGKGSDHATSSPAVSAATLLDPDDGRFSRLVWVLWQDRRPLGSDLAASTDGWVELDPRPARVLARRVRFCEDGGFEEQIVLGPADRPAAFRVRAGPPDPATGRPRRIVLEFAGGNVRAEIEMLRQRVRVRPGPSPTRPPGEPAALWRSPAEARGVQRGVA